MFQLGSWIARDQRVRKDFVIILKLHSYLHSWQFSNWTCKYIPGRSLKIVLMIPCVKNTKSYNQSPWTLLKPTLFCFAPLHIHSNKLLYTPFNAATVFNTKNCGKFNGLFVVLRWQLLLQSLLISNPEFINSKIASHAIYLVLLKLARNRSLSGSNHTEEVVDFLLFRSCG